jgi:hypothetical protein
MKWMDDHNWSAGLGVGFWSIFFEGISFWKSVGEPDNNFKVDPADIEI